MLHFSAPGAHAHHVFLPFPPFAWSSVSDKFYPNAFPLCVTCRIIVGVKYCFRYNQRNRQLRNEETGEPLDMLNVPRPHRRRREKKLMTMDEVNDRFPLVKYKAWRATRADEGLPTEGGITAPEDKPPGIENQGPTATTTTATTPAEGGGKSDDAAMASMASGAREPSDMKDSIVSEPSSPTVQHTEHAAPKSSEKTDSSAKPAVIDSRERASSPQPNDRSADDPSNKDQHLLDDDDNDNDDPIQMALPAELLGNPGDSCAICLDTIEDDDDIRGLTCGHAFHASCVDPWLTSRRACCPLCKADYYIPKPRPEGADPQSEGEHRPSRRHRTQVPAEPQAAFTGGRSNPFRSRFFPSRTVAPASEDRRGTSRNARPQSRNAAPAGLFNGFGGAIIDSSAGRNERPQPIPEFHRPTFSLPSFGRNRQQPATSNSTTEGTTPRQLESGVR